MTFVTTIRDYVEALNTVSDSLGSNFNVTTFISETCVYGIKTLQYWLLYLVSFQWIRDFTLLPILIPEITSAIFKENFFLESPSTVFFNFLEIPDLNQNKFFVGFLNSFFLTLPLSVVHILSIRRLLINGIPAAVYSIGGYLTGQLLFITFIIFGVRAVIVPWLTLEPLHYILGLILIFRVLYAVVWENLIVFRGWFVPQFKNFFIVNFLLAWCEQSAIFQYLGNLTVTGNVTILESFSTTSSVANFFAHCLYVLGILFGGVFFTFFWGFFLLKIKELCIRYASFSPASLIQTVNKASILLALTFTLSSIPFYGFDYLATAPLGFVSQDDLFHKTCFDQRNGKVETFGYELSGMETSFKFMQIDVSPFDRGEYIQVNPEIEHPLTYEDLNYRGEFDWTGRTDIPPIIDSKGSFFTLSKILTKQKTKKVLKVNDQVETTTLFSEKNLKVSPIQPETDSEVLERFTDWYTGDQQQSESSELLKAYQDFNVFSFPPAYLQTPALVDRDIEVKIKEKYYSNPVYKTLLALDVDMFLARQPKYSRLGVDQEQDLYKKRKLLECYYDSVRSYSQLPYNELFEDFFDGTKSFSNKVYNQQFKGTLRQVRRLFSLTPDLEFSKASKNQTLLKFDQPLYRFDEKQKFSPYHEELSQDYQISKNDFFSKPFYAGWDENLRKFVITNKILPRKFAGYKVNIEPDFQDIFSKSYTQKETKKQKIKFTVWPLSFQQVSDETNQKSRASTTLFEPVDEELKSIFGETTTTVPANLKKVEKALPEKREKQGSLQLSDVLAPRRGGWIWPGNPPFKNPFSFKDGVLSFNP